MTKSLQSTFTHGKIGIFFLSIHQCQKITDKGGYSVSNAEVSSLPRGTITPLTRSDRGVKCDIQHSNTIIVTLQ